MSARFRRPVTVTTISHASVFALHGEFDLSNVGPVAIELDAAVRRGDTAIVVDLTDAGFINTTLINALFQACAQLRQRGGHLAIVTTDAHARRVMELTALDQAATVYDTVEDAALASTRR
jgi:anti-sigma B factor antagonist